MLSWNQYQCSVKQRRQAKARAQTETADAVKYLVKDADERKGEYRTLSGRFDTLSGRVDALSSRFDTLSSKMDFMSNKMDFMLGVGCLALLYSRGGS